MDIVTQANSPCAALHVAIPARPHTAPQTPSVFIKTEPASPSLFDGVSQAFAVPPPTAAKKIIETGYNYELGSASHLWEDEHGNLYLSTTMCVALADLSP